MMIPHRSIFRQLIVALTLFITGASAMLQAQELPYAAYFEEAYQQNPGIPQGLLESVAWTNTRIRHLSPTHSCQDLPEYYGVMGLIKDGKGYFQSSLETVARLSGYTEADIIASPRINILAYAKAYAALQATKRLGTRSVDGHRPIIAELSEIPVDGEPTGQYALDQQFYMVLKEMEAPHYNTRFRTRQAFNYNEIFGAENYRVLSADRVTVSSQRIRSVDGATYTAPGARSATCTATNSQPNFAGAIWNPASTSNYGSRDGAKVQYVTIHTIQGSYASCISWFRNARAKVSAHYVVRAFDGQITQMVCEGDKAYHVRTDNGESIGIEHEGFIDDGGAWYTNEMYESSAAIVRDVCARYNINPLQTYGGPSTNGVNTLTNTCYKVKGHQHFRGNNHIDPGPFWDWDRFYRLVNPMPAPTLFTDKKGELEDSGGANGNHLDQDRRTYLIKPAGATAIELEFVELDLEGTAAKPYDYLDIYDGTDENGRFLGRFTGNVKPGKLTAMSGSVFIEFRSDCQVNHKGYRLKYKATDKDAACDAPADLLASNLFAMGTTLTWTGSAARYVVYVKRRNDLKWTRYVVQEPQLAVTGLKSNSVFQWQVQAVCGSDSSAIIGASFVTPNLMGRGGSAQIFSVKTFEGRFYDSGGLESGYGGDENFAYRIVSPGGGKIELTFTEFDTEKDADILTIYDGNGFNDRVIGTYSGTESPKKIRSTGSELLLHFKSDPRTNGAGWNATWKVIGGSTPTTPATPPSRPNPQPTTPTTPPVVTPAPPTNNPAPPTNNPPTTPNPPLFQLGDFALDITYPAAAPTTKPDIDASYRGNFTLKFTERDGSGRGFANRFYNLAERGPQGWRSRQQSGFFFDDFDSGLQNHWQDVAGQWSVSGNRLVQADMSQPNGNLYTDLRQTDEDVYLYQWQARMSGPGSNRRHGIHFFASNPEQEDRGTSYFVWIRDTDGEDQVEIYKTVDNQFDRKAVRTIRLDPGKVYDFKTIYNPSKGRIEVYVNNEFSGSWVDPYPLTSGKGISIRTGNCQLEMDNLIVYHSRGATVPVKVGGSLDPLSGSKDFLVSTLVVDRNINWSRVGQGQSRFGDSPVPDPRPTTPTPTNPDPVPPTTTPVTPPPATSPVVANLPATLSAPIRWKPAGEGQAYYLAAANNGREWGATGSRGFAFDDFSRLRPEWIQITDGWDIRFATLQQTNPVEANSNIYLPLKQEANQSYVYRFRTRLLTTGENKRYGIHILASSPAGTSRGNSYLIWFRFSDSGTDKVELYRADANQMPVINAEAIVQIKTLDWYEVTILTDPATNTISVWMNNYPVLSWQDPNGLHPGGEAISFRTGNAQVQFDDLKVFQAVPAEGALLDAGSANSAFPHRSSGNSPAGRVIWLRQSGRGWAAEEEARTVVR
ncbi:MAG: N-acetylmuramoyl-L-alanine amidase [Bacteroidia bacterium]|nr:N-acetylmuramoyl-L-alanine amidase [Bacteroidia bacterium]